MDLKSSQSLWLNKRINLFLACSILLVYVIGLFVEVMEVDAAQYASMSREMLRTGNWLQVQCNGSDYLDKPPLLFWLSALSFKIFGFSVWAYKLPSFLFSLLGIYAVFRLGKLLYNQNVGYLSAAILITTQAWFMFNNDVRTDTLLASATIITVWLLQEYRLNKNWLFLLSGFGAAALAMMSKGPIGLMVPALALGTDMLLKKEWKAIFDWRWLVGIAFCALLLLPMLIGLYMQFDLHPEKVINGVKGESGVKFFLWTQSFGRITGENVWHNDSSPSLFFVHTFLWSFAPWSLLFLPALYTQVKRLIKDKFKLQNHQEVLTLSGFILPFIILSFSHYKLPHYIFVVYPFAAIMTANYLIDIKKSSVLKWLTSLQTIIWVAVWIAVFLILLFVFPVFSNETHISSLFFKIFVSLIILFFAVLFGLLWKKTRGLNRIVILSLLAAIVANFTMNAWFYPNLLYFQSPSTISQYIVKENIDSEKLINYQQSNYIVNYHLGRIVPFIYAPNQVDSVLHTQKDIWIYTDTNGYHELIDLAPKPYNVVEFEDFRVALLSLKFLNPKTRNEVVEKKYLIHFK